MGFAQRFWYSNRKDFYRTAPACVSVIHGNEPRVLYFGIPFRQAWDTCVTNKLILILTEIPTRSGVSRKDIYIMGCWIRVQIPVTRSLLRISCFDPLLSQTVRSSEDLNRLCNTISSMYSFPFNAPLHMEIYVHCPLHIWFN